MIGVEFKYLEKFFAKSDGRNRWLEHYHEWWPESNYCGKKLGGYKKSYRHFGRFQDIRKIPWTGGEKFGLIETRCISSPSWISRESRAFHSSFSFHLSHRIRPCFRTKAYNWRRNTTDDVRTPFRRRYVTRPISLCVTVNPTGTKIEQRERKDVLQTRSVTNSILFI